MAEPASPGVDAARRDERDFLLASLDDLDAEYAAGDLDEADYLALRSDYTTRAAAAIRALEGHDEPEADDEPTRSWRRIMAWTALVVVVAAVAGVLLAEFSGSRGADDSVTGDIRQSVRTRLFEASELLGTDPDAAIEIYDEVLADEPSNAEALAYRGWLTNLAGDPEAARAYLEDAVLADPTYPDARVFAGSVALRVGDAEAAAAHLDALDELDAPPFIEQLVQAQGLRVGIVEARLLTGEPDAFATSGLTVDEIARAADTLLEQRLEDEQAIQRAIALYDVLLTEAPDDIEVSTEAGWFLARLAFVGGQELASSMDAAERLLDDALAIDPAYPPALVYRAFVRFWLEDLEGARADLAAFDAADAGRDDLEFLVSSTGLRDELA